MKKRSLAILTALLVLLSAAPALALPNPVVLCESAGQVFSVTGLLLPLPVDAKNAQFSVIDDTLAQAEFNYGGAIYTLRQEKREKLYDISGVNETFDNVETSEDFAAYQCQTADNGSSRIAWWYDAARGVTGSLCCASDDAGSFDLILYELFGGLTYGACYAGSAAGGREGFAMDVPLLQTENDEMTAKLQASLQEGVASILSAFAPDASFAQSYMSPSFIGTVFTVEWGGTVSAPGAAYEEYLIFSLHCDTETGELAPLRSLVDTDALAALTYDHLKEYPVSQDWGDESINDAQFDYIAALTQDDWAALLKDADFPSDSWPSAFTAWRGRGFYDDDNDEIPCMIVYIGVPHALQSQITLIIPFETVDMELGELVGIKEL